jgi:hypothetical protein
MAASSEDDTILAVIESLERAAAEGGPGRGDEVTETLARLYVELLGVLSYELPPIVPPPEVKQRLMAAIAGDETQEVPDSAEAAREPVAPVPPVAVAAAPMAPMAPVVPLSPRPSAASAPLPPPPSQPPSALHAPPAEARAGRLARDAPAGRVQIVDWRRPQMRVAGLLAAVLILALLALTGRLTYLLFTQRQTIASLAQQLAVEGRLASHSVELRQQVAGMREKLGLVTSPAVTVSAMRPPGALPGQPSPHGMLFVAADHQHWMLSVSGLAPSDRGHCYQLWFVDDAGPHSGGVFRVAAQGPVELSSPHMPPGTRDARITLEPDPGSRTPSGPEVLAAGRFQTL